MEVDFGLRDDRGARGQGGRAEYPRAIKLYGRVFHRKDAFALEIRIGGREAYEGRGRIAPAAMGKFADMRSRVTAGSRMEGK
jgi:hypothetical protein